MIYASLENVLGLPRASDPKVDLHFWVQSDAQSFKQRIVWTDPAGRASEKPGPLFRTMR
jgi:hypothetical protein